MNRQPIGILDSGVGGLTVVREVLRLLPGEDIVYYADSANCPYGNKSKAELVSLAGHVMDFLCAHGAKIIAPACNTTSSIIEEFDVEVPLVGIIEPAARKIADMHPAAVGVFATEFTIASGCYPRMIAATAPDINVVCKGSPVLAALIECGAFDYSAIDAEIEKQVSDIVSRAPVHDLVLGCTHYPIVLDRFRHCFPQMHFIDPAHEQALAIQKRLVEDDALSDGESGHLTIYTTGDAEVCRVICEALGINVPTQYVQAK